MANEFKFTWSRIGLCFPEWKIDMKQTEFDHYFPSIPDFSGGQISFRYKDDYGIQVHLNQIIEPWLEIAPEKVKTAVSKMHSDLSHKLHAEVVKDLDSSINILESWRKFVNRREKGDWVGNLQNTLDFSNQNDEITLGDYYRFYINSESKNNCPTDILHKINKLPEDSLNEKWRKYTTLARIVLKRPYKNQSNEITGQTFLECVANANEIYKIADELKELKF
jgi:hypothetical protein